MKRYESYPALLAQHVDPILTEGIEFTVERRPLTELKGWELMKGVFRSLAGFFEVVGVHCIVRWPWMAKAFEWDQPLRIQPAGHVGLLMTTNGDVLLEMKLEPGNHGRGHNFKIIWGPPIQLGQAKLALLRDQGKAAPFDIVYARMEAGQARVDIQAPGDGAREDKQNRMPFVVLNDNEIEEALTKMGDAARLIVRVSPSVVRDIMRRGHGNIHLRESLALLLLDQEFSRRWADSFLEAAI